jgi:hypothetical protein
VLVAAAVNFIPAKPAKIKVVPGWEDSPVYLIEAGKSFNPTGAHNLMGDAAALRPNDRIKLGSFGHWHTIVDDEPLQQRVRRVGMSVVPEYQRKLEDNHPSKVHFHFYVVDAPKDRSELCTLDGLILVPRQLVERLKNDDQLAALLADGVAFNLQRQGARLIADSRLLLDTAMAEAIAGFFIPGVNLVALAQDEKMRKILAEMQEQRGRVALALMADAGYDPYQAPEAWRLVAPKKLPVDLDSMNYPNLSGYQLGILSLQYKPARQGESQ